MANEDEPLTFYGTDWCGASRRVRRLLEEWKIAYHWVNIDRDVDAARRVEAVAGGFRSVPTLIWPDGSVLVEPSCEALAEKLGVKDGA